MLTSKRTIDMLGIYTSRFARLSNVELEALGDIAELSSFDKRVRITDIGDMGSKLHFVVKGLVREYSIFQQDEVVQRIAVENEIIMSVLSSCTMKPSGSIVETIESSTLISLDRGEIEKLAGKYRGIEVLFRQIIIELFVQKEKWEQQFLVNNTKQLIVRFLKENPNLVQRTPQKILASYLRVRPETYSRLKHLLKNKQLYLDGED